MQKWRPYQWKTKHITSYDVFSIHLIPTVIVFLTLMIVIGFSWRTAVRDVQTTRDETVAERARFTRLTVEQRMQQYENTLLAAAGLFQSSEKVTRDEWNNFINTLELKNRLPGIVGIGYVEVIKPADIDTFETRIRNEGFPDFALHPKEPAREEYSSIIYIEPYDEANKKVFGYDMFSEPVRRATMEQARDSGRAAMSDIVRLMQDDKINPQPGLLLYQPLYNSGMPLATIEERRAALFGYVYIPFRGNELFGALFKNPDPEFNFAMYDGKEANQNKLIFEQLPNTDDTEFEFVRADEFTLYNQTWTFHFAAKPTIVHSTTRNRPNNVVIGGLIFSLVVAAVVYLLLQKRTRALSNKEEYKLQRAKDDMLSLASHQLRTPATGVKQYLGMLLEGFVGKLDKDQKDILSRAYESNERQLRIINEFLYLAKADADRIVISLQHFDVVGLIKDIIDGMHSEIVDAGHTINTHFPKKQVIISADPHSARMILENLINNAIKYTPHGGQIDIIVENMRGYVDVRVKDTGVGISHNNMKQLFKQFSRIPNELTKQTSGSGIGLYLAKYMAQKNGGDILVESVHGKGSVFTAIFVAKNVRKITAKANKYH